MTPLLWTASRRHLARHPWQFGLAVVGVALGVAVTVAVDLAAGSASRAFDLSAEAVTGRATHQVVGGPEGLPEDLYRRLVLDAGVEPAAPVVEGWVFAAAAGERVREPLHLLGVDPFSEAPFRTHLAGGPAGGGDLARLLGPFLTQPGAVLLGRSLAARLGVAPGDSLPLLAGGRRRTAHVVGLLTGSGAGGHEALDDLLVADVATAQELLGRLGRLSRIDLRAPTGAARPAFLERARRELPPGAALESAPGRVAATRGMTRAFELNLRALSLLALVCGAFLIYNTMTFSVVQRRDVLGTLRALGTTRRQIFALVLGEAAVISAVGSALGLALGVVLARGLIGLVVRTINDLYFVLRVTGVAVDPWTLVRGAGLGLGVGLAAALAPTVEATSRPPRAVLTRSMLEARAHRAVPRAAAAGLALFAAGGLMLVPGGHLALSFFGVFTVLLGAASLSPAATVLLMRAAGRPLGAACGVLGRMAARGVVAALSRTAVAVAALMVAVSVFLGVGVMIGSFRGTVERWLDGTLQADLYLQPPGSERLFDAAEISPDLPRRLAAVPGVAAVGSVRRAEVLTPDGGRVRLVVLDPGHAGRRSFRLLAGDRDAAWRAFTAGRAVFVSEPFSAKRGVRPGDHLRLLTDRGPRAFPVAAIYADYASDQGLVLMPRDAYEAAWDDRRLSGVSIRLIPGADPVAVEAALRRAAGRRTPLVIRSNRALKRTSLAVFDRTFRITGVLRLLAGAVAAIGVLSALMALQLERGRELGVLRANGMTPRQLGAVVTLETGLMGLAAGLLSLPLGAALAAVMVYLINRRSFGWSLEMSWQPGVFAEALLLAVGAAVLAGLYPAWKMARTPPAVALREE